METIVPRCLNGAIRHGIVEVSRVRDSVVNRGVAFEKMRGNQWGNTANVLGLNSIRFEDQHLDTISPGNYW